jgi:phage terminase small subunit
MAPHGLTLQQRLFAHEYLIDRNATRAAIRAGYSARSAGSQAHDLLKKPEIRKIIAIGARKLTETTGITAERVQLELVRILTADVAQAFTDDGCLKPLQDIPEDLRRGISGLEVEEIHEERENEDGEKETVRVGRVVKVKWWSKTDASQQLLRKLGAFRDSAAEKLAESLEELIAAKVTKTKPTDGDDE